MSVKKSLVGMLALSSFAFPSCNDGRVSSLLRGKGAEPFVTPYDGPRMFEGPYLSASDIDRDGDLDFYGRDAFAAKEYLNDNGAFNEGRTLREIPKELHKRYDHSSRKGALVAVSDLDGDGDKDFLVYEIERKKDDWSSAHFFMLENDKGNFTKSSKPLATIPGYVARAEKFLFLEMFEGDKVLWYTDAWDNPNRVLLSKRKE